MTALDTHVLVRFLVCDDEPQAQAAGCREGLTFDRKAARLPFFRLLS